MAIQTLSSIFVSMEQQIIPVYNELGEIESFDVVTSYPVIISNAEPITFEFDKRP